MSSSSRIYYTDPTVVEFDATVTSVRADGECSRVRLDRTAFYPTTGGQPFDTGTLAARGAAASAKVVDVIDEDGEVDHVIEGAIALKTGDTVRGVIDRDRRVDHMQQHTGQHILSAAFDRLFKVRTESFHLGTVSSTIDYIDRVEKGQDVRVDRRALGDEERLEEALFMGLRLNQGLDLERLYQRHGIDIWERYGQDLARYVIAGWLVHEPGRRLALTRHGMLMANDVMAVFIGGTVR